MMVQTYPTLRKTPAPALRIFDQEVFANRLCSNRLACPCLPEASSGIARSVHEFCRLLDCLHMKGALLETSIDYLSVAPSIVAEAELNIYESLGSKLSGDLACESDYVKPQLEVKPRKI